MITLTIAGESYDRWQGSRLKEKMWKKSFIFDLEADPGLMTATQAASSLDAYS